ncbi:hypothetical protein CTH_1067 [Carboxydocella thermautotrophica]|nr:hypothetical protein CTH_1067 [Carboxydocella thermautotrophica]
MLSVLSGTIFLVSVLLISSIQKQLASGIKIIGITGLVSIGLAAIFSGILVGGDRIRANYSSENPEDFLRRKKYLLFSSGLPYQICYWL